MNQPRFDRPIATSLLVAVGFVVSTILFFRFATPYVEARAQASTGKTGPSIVEHDGQHDFDFHIGLWKTHLLRLQHPLTGSKTWVEYDGTSVIRKVWGGRANLVELRVDGSAGHLEGISMRLYNPESRQWSLNFAGAAAGSLGEPTVGEFKDGRGEFYDQETFNGRMIFVRNVFSNITPTSCHFEQSFSDDGGKTWEVNWIATDTRIDEHSPDANIKPTAARQGSADWNHDFDFNLGTFKTHISRLQHPLTGSRTWTDYDGVSVVRRLLDGRASLFELEASGKAGHLEGAGLRLYNPQSHQWGLNWVNSSVGTMGRPNVGEFKDGHGEFYDQEELNGRAIMVRNGFSEITPDSSRFEQAFSNDGGKTWETNWIMTFVRTSDKAED